MRVREYDGGRESTKDDISKLDATGGYCVAQSEIIFTQKLREIVEENKEKSQSTAIQVSGSML
jgi:hypothetical protein